MDMNRLKHEVTGWLAARDIPPKDRAAVGEAVGTWLDENVRPGGTTEERKALLAERKKLEGTLEKTLARVQPHTAKLKADRDAKWDAFAQAAMAQTQGEASATGELDTLRRQIDTLERQLADGAPRAVLAFLDEMRAVMSELWRTSPVFGVEEAGTDVASEHGFWAQPRMEKILRSNEESLARHKSTVLDVCERATRLKATAIDDESARRELEELRQEAEKVSRHTIELVA